MASTANASAPSHRASLSPSLSRKPPTPPALPAAPTTPPRTPRRRRRAQPKTPLRRAPTPPRLPTRRKASPRRPHPRRRWKHDLGGRFVAASVLIVRLEARVGSRASLFLLHAMGDEAAHRDSAGDLSPSPGLGPLHHQHRQPHRHGRREEVDMDHRHILVGRGPDPLSATGGRFFLVS